MTTRDGAMKKVYLINETLLFEPELRRLGPLVGYPHRATTLHGPVSECLLLLLENNNQVVAQRLFFASVWEKQGTVVSTNALYQTISQIRKVLKYAGMEEDVIKTLPKEGFKSTAQVKVGELDDFIPPHIPSSVLVSAEESVESEPAATIAPALPSRPSFFNSSLAYSLAGLLFLLSCGVLYSVLNAGKSDVKNYQSIGKLNGCDVFSSLHDKEISSEVFTSLSKRYAIRCQAGGTVLMTLNYARQSHSVIICDRHPKDKNAQCDSIIYRPQNYDD